jgi:predicted XRE-type DNA-binding protein
LSVIVTKDERIVACIEAGRYTVMTAGEVNSNRFFGNEGKSGPITPHFNKRGYGYVMLYDLDGKPMNCRLNRVVALAHIPNPFGLPEVNHEDGVKRNNAVANLKWCGRSYNERHARSHGLKSGQCGETNPSSKLSAADVEAIRALATTGHLSQRKIGARFGVTQSVISTIKNNKAWSSV